MQQPGGEKGRQRRHRQRTQWAKLPQGEMRRIEEKLHHEVLPIDINPAPEISETRSQQIQMVGFRKIKTKHVQ